MRAGTLWLLVGIFLLACNQAQQADGSSGEGGPGHIAADASVGPKTDGGADGAAGSDGAASSDGAAGTTAGDAGDSWQKWCDPGALNDPACPVSEPTPGIACTDLGLRCAYPESFGVALDDCADQGAGPWWTSTGVTCSYDCAALDTDAGAAVDASTCDARPILGCEPAPYQTRQTLLDSQLEAVAEKCGVPTGHEHVIWVALDNGCATRVVGADASVAACMASELAGTRFSCALDRACGVAEYELP